MDNLATSNPSNIQDTMMMKLVTLLVAILFVSSPAMAKERSIAVTDDTAIFLPIAADHCVDFFVEKVDGEKTKFGVFDAVVVDAGPRTLEIRLEHQPACGTSVVVGGLANLLLRAATNKTFRTTMQVDVEGGKEYQIVANARDEKLELVVVDHTAEELVQSQAFELKEGKFERIF